MSDTPLAEILARRVADTWRRRDNATGSPRSHEHLTACGAHAEAVNLAAAILDVPANAVRDAVATAAKANPVPMAPDLALRHRWLDAMAADLTPLFAMRLPRELVFTVDEDDDTTPGGKVKYHVTGPGMGHVLHLGAQLVDVLAGDGNDWPDVLHVTIAAVPQPNEDDTPLAEAARR